MLQCSMLNSAGRNGPKPGRPARPMPLPPATPTRRLQHRRAIDVQMFSRDDGLWEVDATIVDVKTRETMLAGQPRPAGTPIHDMLLRLVVDTAFNVIDAGSQTRWMPYPGECSEHGDAYRQLIGLNLLKGFRYAVRERVGGKAGCTHLTELAEILPTAVLQAFAGTVIDTQGHAASAKRPFQIDRCRALRADGAVVKQHYPRWFARGEALADSAHNAPAVSAPAPSLAHLLAHSPADASTAAATTTAPPPAAPPADTAGTVLQPPPVRPLHEDP